MKIFNFFNAHTDDKWKFMRSQLSPMFSTSKLKQAGGLALELVDEYMLDFEKGLNADQERIAFDIKK